VLDWDVCGHSWCNVAMDDRVGARGVFGSK